jgi:hypothetical protein
MADSPARWREPTSLIPLRWGTWTERSWGGLWLILGGGAAIAGSGGQNDFAPVIGVLGIAAHAIGWLVLPARGWRRILVLPFSLLAMGALLPGPGYLIVLAVPFWCWMVVRQRPIRTWSMGIFVIAAGVVFSRLQWDYDRMLPAVLVQLGIVVGAAWAARAVHAATTRPSRPRRTLSPRNPSIS